MGIKLKSSYHSKKFKEWGFHRGRHGCLKRWGLAKEEGGLLKIHPKDYKHPIYVRTGTSDVILFQQIIMGGEYGISLDKPPRIIIDCGANIGLTSIYWANKYPDATIVAVEPESSNYELLLKNTSGYKNIKPLEGGVWFRSAQLIITNQKTEEKHWGFTVEEAPAGEGSGLRAYSIPELMEMFSLPHIDLLKLDIEGSEKELFENEPDTWLSKTRNLILELHDRMKPHCSLAMTKVLPKYDFAMGIRGENLIFHFSGHPQK